MKAKKITTTHDFRVRDLNIFMQNQRAFQKLCGVPIDDLERADELAETFLYKAIEECIELRKTNPSGLMRYSKTQPGEINRDDMLGELSDVVLFLINFMIVRKITFEELMNNMLKIQENNFKVLLPKLKKEIEEKMKVAEAFTDES